MADAIHAGRAGAARHMSLAAWLAPGAGACVLDVAPDGTVVLACDRCAATFAWTPSQQRAYAAQGFTRPRRCRPCRRLVRRARRPQETPA